MFWRLGPRETMRPRAAGASGITIEAGTGEDGEGLIVELLEKIRVGASRMEGAEDRGRGGVRGAIPQSSSFLQAEGLLHCTAGI